MPAESTWYKIANWEEFQHYKDRCPPWVKLHVSLLSSDDWVVSDDASRVLLIASMVVASKNNGKIDASPRGLAYMRRVAYLNSEPDLTPLIDSGFLVPLANASATLADASTLQADATKRREEKRRGEEKQRPYLSVKKIHIQDETENMGVTPTGEVVPGRGPGASRSEGATRGSTDRNREPVKPRPPPLNSETVQKTGQGSSSRTHPSPAGVPSEAGRSPQSAQASAGQADTPSPSVPVGVSRVGDLVQDVHQLAQVEDRRPIGPERDILLEIAQAHAEYAGHEFDSRVVSGALQQRMLEAVRLYPDRVEPLRRAMYEHVCRCRKNEAAICDLEHAFPKSQRNPYLLDQARFVGMVQDGEKRQRPAKNTAKPRPERSEKTNQRGLEKVRAALKKGVTS